MYVCSEFNVRLRGRQTDKCFVGNSNRTKRIFHLPGILVGKIIFSLCIAKFFIVFAFDGFYVYSAELFPTVIRYAIHIF